MSTDRFETTRDALIAHVEETRARPRIPRLLVVIGLLAAGALGGVGLSTAAFAATGAFDASPYPSQPSGQPVPELPDAVDAPPGTVPGTPIVSLLGHVVATTVDAPRERSLDDRPDDATHVRVTVTPLTPGTLAWGTDAGGNNPRASWTQADVDFGGETWSDVPLDDTTTTLYLTPGDGASALVTTQYIVHVPTRLGVNAAGETYGAAGATTGTPDLIAANGVAPDGSEVEGYVRRSDLFDDRDQPTSPADAATPRTAPRDIPVYESDGTTRIGTLRSG